MFQDFQGFLNDLQDWDLSLNEKDKKMKHKASPKDNLVFFFVSVFVPISVICLQFFVTRREFFNLFFYFSNLLVFLLLLLRNFNVQKDYLGFRWDYMS